MSPIYDLSTSGSVNIAEDVRGAASPVPGSPFSVTTTASVILPANTARATTTIINSGSVPVFLREGSTPSVSPSAYTYILPPNRMWEPDSNFRFTGAIQAITALGTSTVAVSESIILL